MYSTKKILAVICFEFILSGFLFSQQGVLTRNTNLRSEPRVSSSTKIKTLPKGTSVTLATSEQTSGFYSVTVGSSEGWVLARNVKLQAPALSETEAADTISASWEKPEPQPAVLSSSEGDCGETGNGGDALTNTRKNRVDIPTSYHLVTFKAISTLDYPQGAPRSREQWSQEQLDAIKTFEGVPLTVEGYLYKVKVESYSPQPGKSGGESTNCHFHLAADVDWHMPLTQAANDGEDSSVIVETTPRVRQNHPNWTTAALKKWTSHVGSNPNNSFNHQTVRISGWLMLDPEHQDMIDNGLRATLWEIHPVTRIEVQQPDGSWIDIDK
jgi:hypothetical protein